jgi:signal transduction histidine kinase
MKTADRNNLDLNIAQARAVLSVLALASWYIDPVNGGWFFIDAPSMLVLSLHLVYSLVTLVLLDRRVWPERIGTICSVLDVAFAAVVTVVTEGPTSPSWLFFVFAIIAVDCRTGFRAAIAVTVCSAVLYFTLLAMFVAGLKNDYLMRSAYLAIVGYLIGFIGEQRTRFAARVHDLEAAAQRHAIARTFHDGYVQSLAGVNLRLETCRALIGSQRFEEALGQLTDLQKGVAREYDEVRAYIRSLAEVGKSARAAERPFEVETHFQVKADFAGRAPVVEQVLQIVLEGMRNTWRHGQAARASIDIGGAGELIRISMDDDGVGFPNAEHPPWAIASRVSEHGGRLSIRGGENRGAHLLIEIPAA